MVKAKAELPFLTMGYHVPALQDPDKDWEPYALEILAGVLDGNASARLNQNLVRNQKIAVSVGAGYDLIQRGKVALFELDGTPSEGTTAEALEKAILQEIETIKEAGVTQEELKRVKAQVIAGDVYQRDSVFYQAMQIGRLETSGYSWRLLDKYPDKLAAVTAEQVQQVAKKYLIRDNLTTAILDPQPLQAGEKPASNMEGSAHVH